MSTNTLALPANLAALAKVATKDTGHRYATSGVYLEVTATGYRAEATTGRILARVDGLAPVAERVPPTLADAPNGATSAIIPGSDWVAGLKRIHKKARSPHDVVHVVLGQHVTTFGDWQDQSQTAENIDGRWPNTDRVLPTGSPTATVAVDGHLLAQLLTVAAAFAEAGTDAARVVLELRQSKPGCSQTPVVLRSSNSTGQTFTGLLVPLASK